MMAEVLYFSIQLFMQIVECLLLYLFKRMIIERVL